MTSLSNTNFEGKSTDFILERFQFKLDRAKQAMVFGGKGFFSNTELKLELNRTFAGMEIWYATDESTSLAFKEKLIVYADVGPVSGIYTLTADCDKF